jgi:hypothetical protein
MSNAAIKMICKAKKVHVMKASERLVIVKRRCPYKCCLYVYVVGRIVLDEEKKRRSVEVIEEVQAMAQGCSFQIKCGTVQQTSRAKSDLMD